MTGAVRAGLRIFGERGREVEGTLFFAGEATVTDGQMGTVFGALESGLRAAREVSTTNGHE